MGWGLTLEYRSVDKTIRKAHPLKFRTKLLLTFLVVGLVTNGISLSLLYYLARQSLYEFYRAKLLSITAIAAAMVDGESLKSIQTAADSTKTEYVALPRHSA